MFKGFLLIMKRVNRLIKTIKERIDRVFLKIEKRARTVITTLIITGLMLFSTFFFFERVFLFVFLFIFLVYFGTYFAILEEIKGIEWFTLFIMPIFLTVSYYLFYFLFPIRWLTRLPFIFVYGISFYAILLASNILNVKMERSLQLYRAAFSVNFFLQVVTIFLFCSSILSFHFDFLINSLIIGLVVFIFGLQLLWSTKMSEKIDKEIVSYALIIFLVIFQLSIFLSFIEIKTTIYSLFIATSYYSLGGLIYNWIDKRLFKETVREYLIVWGFIFLILLLSVR